MSPAQHVIFLAVVCAVCFIGIMLGWSSLEKRADWSSSEQHAIDLVKNHVPSAELNTIDPLTIGDLVELEVKSLTMQGLQTRAVWGAVDNGNGWYVVTARFEYIDPTVGWDELYSMQWGANLDTKEIVALDSWIGV